MPGGGLSYLSFDESCLRCWLRDAKRLCWGDFDCIVNNLPILLDRSLTWACNAETTGSEDWTACSCTRAASSWILSAITGNYIRGSQFVARIACILAGSLFIHKVLIIFSVWLPAHNSVILANNCEGFISPNCKSCSNCLILTIFDSAYAAIIFFFF